MKQKNRVHSFISQLYVIKNQKKYFFVLMVYLKWEKNYINCILFQLI